MFLEDYLYDIEIYYVENFNIFFTLVYTVVHDLYHIFTCEDFYNYQVKVYKDQDDMFQIMTDDIIINKRISQNLVVKIIEIGMDNVIINENVKIVTLHVVN